MNKERITQQIGVCRPIYSEDKHELTIVLIGDDGEWSATMDLDTRKDSPALFVIFELPGKVRKPTGEMRQISDTASAFEVRLVGSTAPAKLTNLSATPQKQWMFKMFKTFAQGPGIAVLFKAGRISVTLHEG